MALIAFMVAVDSLYHEDTLLAIVNFAATLFFVYLYQNPAIALSRNRDDFEAAFCEVKDEFLLWNAIAIGLFGVAFEIYQRFG